MLATFEERWHGRAAMLRRLGDAVEQNPYQIGPRLVLCRKLLNAGMANLARPHLELLASNAVAEAAYYLGLAASQAGQLPEALDWLSQALALNPSHTATAEQMELLKRALK
jgi:tetratricopeptide (TPR) repeat protein